MVTLNRSPEGNVPQSEWEVVLLPVHKSEYDLRAQALERMRIALPKHLEDHPDATTFVLKSDFYRIQASHRCGEWTSKASLKLAYRQEAPLSTASEKEDALLFPNAETDQLAARLVGLEEIQASVLQRMGCGWDGELEQWGTQQGHSIPSSLRETLVGNACLFIFAGDPGTGKSALARVIVNHYCQRQGIPGLVWTVGTETRGNGLVNNFGTQVRAAFANLTQGTDEELRVLILEEADALAMRRDEANAHQEDRAGSATLLQSLDLLRGRKRRVVFCTTNLLKTIDPAVQRRAEIHLFDRPSRSAREQLLAQYLPENLRHDLKKVASATHNMTPADIEKAAQRWYLTAMQENSGISLRSCLRSLRSSPRTRRM